MSNKSLYGRILSSVIDGRLPEEFSLNDFDTTNDGEVRWADGALDGAGIYHLRPQEISQRSRELLVHAINAASDGDYQKAEKLLMELGQDVKAYTAIEEIGRYIVSRSDDVNAKNLFEFGMILAMDSTDRECVKYGLSILSVFNAEGNEILKEMVRTIGLSDEFTLYAMSAMSNWENGNQEIWELAKKVNGWGVFMRLG